MKTVLEIVIAGNINSKDIMEDLIDYEPVITHINGDTIVTVTKNIIAKDAVNIITTCEKYGDCEEFFTMSP